MEKTGNHPLFVEPATHREIQHVDAIEFVVLACFDQLLDRIGHLGVGGLLQYCELGLGVAHAESQDEVAGALAQDLVNGEQCETSANARAASSPPRPASPAPCRAVRPGTRRSSWPAPGWLPPARNGRRCRPGRRR